MFFSALLSSRWDIKSSKGPIAVFGFGLRNGARPLISRTEMKEREKGTKDESLFFPVAQDQTFSLHIKLDITAGCVLSQPVRYGVGSFGGWSSPILTATTLAWRGYLTRNLAPTSTTFFFAQGVDVLLARLQKPCNHMISSLGLICYLLFQSQSYLQANNPNISSMPKDGRWRWPASSASVDSKRIIIVDLSYLSIIIQIPV